MQVYFSWQLQSVLGNLKLFLRISTPKFQSTGMSALEKDKTSCAGSTGGVYQRGHGALCSTATAAAHTNSWELSLLLPSQTGQNHQGAELERACASTKTSWFSVLLLNVKINEVMEQQILPVWAQLEVLSFPSIPQVKWKSGRIPDQVGDLQYLLQSQKITE